MDEEYVQEHILTGGIVAPVDEPRRFIHGRLEPFRSALSRHDTSLVVWLLLCLSRSESHGLRRPPND